MTGANSTGEGRFGPPAGLGELVRNALAEDVRDGDRTTRWTVPRERPGRARIVARADGVVAGREPAELTFTTVDAGLSVRWATKTGDWVAAGDEVAGVQGALGSLLTAERVALNFLGRLSGVASTTRRFVEAVEGTGARITDTRKTTPGWRALEKAAARAGGAVNHRMGLHDMVLVKENHIRAAGSVEAALEAVMERARSSHLEVEIEVTDLGELEAALAEAPDRILLDNMSLETLARAVELVQAHEGSRPLLEASGGVTLDTVRQVAGTGVDLISVGALTHSAPALDLSLLVEEA
ncbi:MAG: carboxylating nicotinate-nucleotide diphosphorylase [Gemmatimonadota bacterium]